MEDLTKISIDPQKFKAARERAGKSQSQVARAVGIGKAAISKLECGVGLPSADVLARLLILYNVPISEVTARAV